MYFPCIDFYNFNRKRFLIFIHINLSFFSGIVVSSWDNALCRFLFHADAIRFNLSFNDVWRRWMAAEI